MTVRAFPDLSATVSRITINAAVANQTFWFAVEQILTFMPRINALGSSVQAYVWPASFTGGASIVLEAYLFDTTSKKEYEDLSRGLESLNLPLEAGSNTYERFSEYLAIPKGLNQAGIGMIPGSIFLSRDLLTSAKGPSRVSKTLSELGMGFDDVISIDGFGGGKLIAKDHAESAVHPDWRSTLASLTVGRGLPFGEQKELTATIEHEMVHKQLPALRALESGRRSAYLAVAYPGEKHFQDSFWGHNYNRLLKIKRSLDPDDLFLTRLGVGSEAWDDEGMCRSAQFRFLDYLPSMDWVISWLRL